MQSTIDGTAPTGAKETSCMKATSGSMDHFCKACILSCPALHTLQGSAAAAMLLLALADVWAPPAESNGVSHQALSVCGWAHKQEKNFASVRGSPVKCSYTHKSAVMQTSTCSHSLCSNAGARHLQQLGAQQHEVGP